MKGAVIVFFVFMVVIAIPFLIFLYIQLTTTNRLGS
jgi:hypothetical protein